MDKNIQELANVILESTADMSPEEQEFFIDYTLFSLGYCAPYLKAKINGDTECGECPGFDETLPAYVKQLTESGGEVPAEIRKQIYRYINGVETKQRGLECAGE